MFQKASLRCYFYKAELTSWESMLTKSRSNLYHVNWVPMAPFPRIQNHMYSHMYLMPAKYFCYFELLSTI